MTIYVNIYKVVRNRIENVIFYKLLIFKGLAEWAPGDSNPEPTDYESGALTVELEAPFQKAGEVILFYNLFQEKMHA